ncbi:activating transcription factor 3 [Uranotaenia lowii]|uniref:activating transcription factor 3 n=1 Tax=Uranotaenia lowii TaxID=190385 RepID=UPI00247B143A|nr:activating transcription factor 3 [Uranotaenia lowii]
MFNSNLSLTVPPLLGIDGGVCTTPRTPEILNSLMAMTNPLEYSFPVTSNTSSSNNSIIINNNNNNNNGQSTCGGTINSSVTQACHDSHSNSSDSPLDSPAGHGKTPSVQQTRSQLIKAGVKLLIQNKRKHSGCDSSDGNESSNGAIFGSLIGSSAGTVCGSNEVSSTVNTPNTTAAVISTTSTPRSGAGKGGRARRSPGGGSAPAKKPRHDTDSHLTSEDDGEMMRGNTSGCSSGSMSGGGKHLRPDLTPEDEDRRRRRRERNKIAATKCRMKKRERTVNLVNESETLDAQNKDLKSQVTELENQRRKLIEMLQAHSPSCVHHKGYQPLPSLSTIINNKFTSDMSFLDGPSEIKYSECLKASNDIGDSGLPPGYCKLSPTEVNYATPTDVMDVNSFNNQSMKSEYIPNVQPQQQERPEQPTRSKPGPKPRQRSTKRTVTVTTTTTITEQLPPISVPAASLPSADFILKNELIDTSSPYTTVQSADRFLFENSFDLYNNNNNDSNTLDSHHVSDCSKLASIAMKDNTSNALLEINASFDTAILKSTDYTMLNATLQTQQQQNNLLPHMQQQQQQHCHLQHDTMGLAPHHQQQQQQNHQQQHQNHLHNQLASLHSHQHQSCLGGSIITTNDFLILPEHDGSEFTDLDSGMTSFASGLNGSCLA